MLTHWDELLRLTHNQWFRPLVFSFMAAMKIAHGVKAGKWTLEQTHMAYTAMLYNQ